MNRFIKKNLFLVGVLGLTALIVLVLLVLSVIQTIEMSKHIRKTEEMRETNKKLMNQRPPAVKENIALIQKDIDGYLVKGEDMKQFFGQTLNPALNAFCGKIKVDKQKLCDLFKEFWEKEKETLGPREQTYRRFRATRGKIGDHEEILWDFNTWDEALNLFVETAQPTTMEKIDEQNREEIFLSSMGLPRNLGNDERRLDVFTRTMQSSVVDLLENKKVQMLGVYFTSSGISELKTDEDFIDQGRRDDEKGMPGAPDGMGPGMGMERKARKSEPVKSPSSMGAGPGMGGAMGPGMNDMGMGGGNSDEKKVEPADVVRNWEIMSDLAKRISDSKIESLEYLSFGPLTGREDGNVTYYTYEFTLRGSQSAVRTFMNNLNLAYKENRIYVVRNVSFRKLEDQTQDLIDVAQGILAPPNKDDETALSTDENNMMPGMMPGDRPARGNRRGMVDPMGGMAPDMGAAPRGGKNVRGGMNARGGMGPDMGMGAPMGMNEMSKETTRDYFTEQKIYGEIVVGRSDQCEATFTADYVVYTANVLK